MAEKLAVHESMEWPNPEHLDSPEFQISQKVQDTLLANERSAHVTYNIVEDSAGSWLFTITLWHAVKGNITKITFNWWDEIVQEVNNYIILKADTIENPITLNPDIMNGYDSIDIALLQDDINIALEKLIN